MTQNLSIPPKVFKRNFNTFLGIFMIFISVWSALSVIGGIVGYINTGDSIALFVLSIMLPVLILTSYFVVVFFKQGLVISEKGLRIVEIANNISPKAILIPWEDITYIDWQIDYSASRLPAVGTKQGIAYFLPRRHWAALTSFGLFMPEKEMYIEMLNAIDYYGKQSGKYKTSSRDSATVPHTELISNVSNRATFTVRFFRVFLTATVLAIASMVFAWQLSR